MDSHQAEATVARDKNETINSYITDMLSLEDHIEKAVRSQLQDLKDYPEVVTELREIHRKLEHHISDLRGLSDRRNAGGISETVKRAGAAAAGVAAGIIDLIRTEGLPKNLRDNYTAFSLANIGYVMLHTTALALDEREVAELAQQHLLDYAQAVVRLNAIVPAAVVGYLKQEGLPAREDVLPQIGRTIQDAWERQPSAASLAEEQTSVRHR